MLYEDWGGRGAKEENWIFQSKSTCPFLLTSEIYDQ